MMELYSRVILSEDHRQVRLTVNEFRDVEYLHLREYYLTFEEDWMPSDKGIAIPLEIDSSKELFIALSEIISLSESEEVLEKFKLIKEI